MDAGFLGRGWSFPLGPDQSGEVASASGAEDVKQAIWLILETEPGERVMRPDFGAGLRGLVFEPLDARLVALVQHRVETALTLWEPRIDLDTVKVAPDPGQPGRLNVEVGYRIRSTNTFYNLVYPFYLKERSG